MRKNKTIAYMLAVTLLVGGTFLGTKALFTDKINTVGELSISTGDVDIKVIEDAGWILDRNGNEHADGSTVFGETGTGEGTLVDGGDNFTTDNPLANNLKPGDILTKTIKVQNQGTLIAELDLTNNADVQNRLGDLKDLITATGEILGDKTELLPGETATLKLKLEVNNEGGDHNKDGYNTDDIEDYKVDLNGAWVLTATQQTEHKFKPSTPAPSTQNE
ncbi:hypothetical protein [Terrisporobacter sp.]